MNEAGRASTSVERSIYVDMKVESRDIFPVRITARGSRVDRIIKKGNCMQSDLARVDSEDWRKTKGYDERPGWRIKSSYDGDFIFQFSTSVRSAFTSNGECWPTKMISSLLDH